MKININGNLVEVDVEAFNKAVDDKSESFEIKSEGLVIRTTEQQETFETNLKKEVGDYKVEIGRKEVLSGLGLEIEGKGYHKDLSKSIEAINAFVGVATSKALEDAGKAPDGKIKELNADLETLRGNLKTKDDALLASQGEFTSYKNQAIVNNGLANELGKFKDINNNDNRLLIFNSKQKTGLDENGVVRGYNQDGSVMKDSNLNPLAIGDVVNKYYEANPDNLMKVEGGAGGGDSTGGGNTTDWDSFVKTQQEAGNSPASDEFRLAQANAVASGALVL